MKVIDLSQNGDGWLTWRDSGIGSSDCPAILNGKHFQSTRESLWSEKVAKVHGLETLSSEDRPKKRFNNAAMERGKLLEGPAREWYEKWTGNKAPPLCAVSDNYPFMKASLDGYIESTSTILEIKCPVIRKQDGGSDHFDALEGKVPEKYYAQLAHQCLVVGTKSVHYLSRGDDNYFKALDVHVLISWSPPQELLEKLLKLEIKFWQCVLNRVKPSKEGWE